MHRRLRPHEQPEAVRSATVREALRVTRKGGKVVFVDYHRPLRTHPLRYLMRPILRALEPFALDLWEEDIDHWIPEDGRPVSLEKKTYFGGLYQKVVVVR